MIIKKLELAPPYTSRDNINPNLMKVEFLAEFTDELAALLFFIELNKLVAKERNK